MQLPPEVAAMLDALVPGIQQALGGNLVGVYLRGSLAMGDFDPVTSDLDYFVVTARRVSAAQFAVLRELHARLATLPNRYATRLEAPYIARAALRRWRPGHRHPTIYCGEALTWSEHESNWVLERWMVRERGVVLLGPDPRTLVDPVSPSDLRAAVRARLDDWARWIADPDDPDLLPRRAHNAYVVQTMCRALYTLATGELASKPQATTWALTALPDPWRGTVARARAWHGDPTPDPTIIAEIGRFVRWARAQASPRPAAPSAAPAGASAPAGTARRQRHPAPGGPTRG